MNYAMMNNTPRQDYSDEVEEGESDEEESDEDDSYEDDSDEDEASSLGCSENFTGKYSKDNNKSTKTEKDGHLESVMGTLRIVYDHDQSQEIDASSKDCWGNDQLTKIVHDHSQGQEIDTTGKVSRGNDQRTAMKQDGHLELVMGQLRVVQGQGIGGNDSPATTVGAQPDAPRGQSSTAETGRNTSRENAGSSSKRRDHKRRRENDGRRSPDDGDDDGQSGCVPGNSQKQRSALSCFVNTCSYSVAYLSTLV